MLIKKTTILTNDHYVSFGSLTQDEDLGFSILQENSREMSYDNKF